MSEYGPCLTIGAAAEMDKERVRHALIGELACGEDERGFEYEEADKEECDRFILSVIDKWVYHAKELADSGRAMERVAEANGFFFKNHFREYVDERAKAGREFDDYVYEHDLEELHEEAELAIGGCDD